MPFRRSARALGSSAPAPENRLRRRGNGSGAGSAHSWKGPLDAVMGELVGPVDDPRYAGPS